MMLQAWCHKRGNPRSHPHTLLLPLPAGHSPSQNPIPRAPAAPGSHKHFQDHIGLFPWDAREIFMPWRWADAGCPTKGMGTAEPAPAAPTGCPPTSSLARMASSARCLMASRSSRQLRSLLGTLSSTARHRDTRVLTASRCKGRQCREAPGIADSCRVCQQCQHRLKTAGEEGQPGCTGSHLLGEGSLLILQPLKGVIREAPKQEALPAPGALGKGQGHRRSGSAPGAGTGNVGHMCALPG